MSSEAADRNHYILTIYYISWFKGHDCVTSQLSCNGIAHTFVGTDNYKCSFSHY